MFLMLRTNLIGLFSLLILCTVLMMCSTNSLAGPYTIGIVEGETLRGGGSNDIASDSAIGGRTLKVSTLWNATGQIRIDGSAYKILVRGAGDNCNGAPILEVLIDGQVVLTETYPDKNWKLGIASLNMNLPAGTHEIAARLKNPLVTEQCRRAVYVDIVYIEEIPTPTNPNPSGEPMPVGDLPGWKQVFVDDFNEDVALGDFPSAVQDRWEAYPYPWRDTTGQRTNNPEIGGWYHPRKTVSVKDGVLDVWLRSKNIDNADKNLVAAILPRIHGGNARFAKGQLYGRYAVRFRADMVKGYKTAWLLWPDSGVHPRDGEIDFPEGNLTGDIQGYMHWQNAVSGDQQYWALSGQSYYNWHTAVIEWEPGRVAFYLDGELLTNASGGKSEWFDKIPNTPMHWVIQTETRLDNEQPTTADQGHVEIDWVAVWKKR